MPCLQVCCRSGSSRKSSFGAGNIHWFRGKPIIFAVSVRNSGLHHKLFLKNFLGLKLFVFKQFPKSIFHLRSCFVNMCGCREPLIKRTFHCNWRNGIIILLMINGYFPICSCLFLKQKLEAFLANARKQNQTECYLQNSKNIIF